MTVQAWSTVVDQSTDAAFRVWGAEFNAKMAAAGMVQTADTGQINWVTVVRPATNNDAGYEIWRFNDSLQATAPVFLRINYGAGSSVDRPRITIQVGTASNGSGTLSGIGSATAARQVTSGGVLASTVTSYNSWMCHTEGLFWFLWKDNSGANAGFLFCRGCDTDGVPVATDAFVYWNQSTGFQSLRYAATAQAFTLQTTPATAGVSIIAGSLTSSLDGSDFQAYLMFMAAPRMRPIFGACNVILSEVPLGNTFSHALIGSTPRTYICLGTRFGTVNSNNSGNYVVAALWE